MTSLKGVKVLLALAMALSLPVLALGGCSSPAETEPVHDADTGSSLRTVGVDDNSNQHRQVTNGTGADITAIAVRSTGSDYPLDFLEGQEAWKDGEAVELCYTISSGAIYDVKLTAGGKSYVLHDVHFGDITNILHDDGSLSPITIKIKDGLAYLEYENMGETVSTLAHEKDVK